MKKNKYEGRGMLTKMGFIELDENELKIFRENKLEILESFTMIKDGKMLTLVKLDLPDIEGKYIVNGIMLFNETKEVILTFETSENKKKFSICLLMNNAEDRSLLKGLLVSHQLIATQNDIVGTLLGKYDSKQRGLILRALNW